MDGCEADHIPTYCFAADSSDIKYIEKLQISCGAEGCQHSWDEHGLTITIPSGAVPKGTEASLTIGVSISGNFVLPPDMTLVSPVFCVDAVPNCFEKDVELKVPHILDVSEETSEHISFVRASCDSSDFHFEEFPGGVFKPGLDYGVFSTKSFSLYAIAVKKFACGLGSVIRTATVYFCVPENRTAPVWQVYVYVSQRSCSIHKVCNKIVSVKFYMCICILCSTSWNVIRIDCKGLL